VSRLPPHHIRRPRVTAQCAEASVVVVEAGAGYGKTVLGAELAAMWRAVAVEALLHEGGVSAPLYAARLRAAVSDAGFREAAAAAAQAGEDPAGGVDGLPASLTAQRCAFIVDDAHHAGAPPTCRPGEPAGSGECCRYRVRSQRPVGRGGEHVGVLATVVLGQDGTGLTRSACDAALADLAADDRKSGNGNGKAVGP
jgi:hypothetical protein